MKIAIIPARGGSKRIKNKNIVNFCGKPLIAYSLEVAKKSGLFDKIHVSTESDEIRAVSEGLGFPVDFMRDPSLADDYVGTLPVVRWVLEQYLERSENYEEVCLILPTAPLIEAEDLKKAFELFKLHAGNYSVLPVVAYPAPIEWAFDKLGSELLEPCQPGKFKVRSQDLGKKYYDSGTFAWFSKKRIFSDSVAGDENFMAYVLDRYKAVDIDDMEDLRFARHIYQGLEAKQ